MDSLTLLPIAQLVLCMISFILHMIALPASYWAFFSSRTELEYGHYGLWGICSMKAPYFRDDCDPLDTFFRPPPHMSSAGIVSIIYAIVLGLFFPFVVLRIRQIHHQKPELLLKPKTIAITKIIIIIIAAVLSSLILLLTTLRETIYREQTIFHSTTLENYKVSKGYAFWMEVSVTVINIFIIILCVFENNRLEPSDIELATFSFSSSPDSAARLNFMTEYINPINRKVSNVNNKTNQLRSDHINLSTISDKTLDGDGWSRCNSPHCQLQNKSFPITNLEFSSASFINPAYLDDTPDLRSMRKY